MVDRRVFPDHDDDDLFVDIFYVFCPLPSLPLHRHVHDHVHVYEMVASCDRCLVEVYSSTDFAVRADAGSLIASVPFKWRKRLRATAVWSIAGLYTGLSFALSLFPVSIKLIFVPSPSLFIYPTSHALFYLNLYLLFM